MTGGAGSDGGCRSSLLLGGSSSGGRGSSQGKGSGGRAGNKGSNSGGSKKKAGWEDAELEFYKEAYPMPLQDGGYSQHLATLLPSTRYVNTMGRGTVQRRRRKSAKRRRADQHMAEEMDGAGGRTMLAGTAGANATWVRTGRRGSDTYLEVLPDLTKGVDEEQTWEELQEVRCQPISLSEKRKLKRQLLSAPTLRTRGWQAVHLTRRKFTKRWGDRVRAWLGQLELWRAKLRYVEGNFGTGLVALFSFIKWLLFLNLFMSAVIVIFILLPQLFFVQEDPCSAQAWDNTTESSTTASHNLVLRPASSALPPSPAAGCCHVPYREGVQQRVLQDQSMELHDKIVAYLLQTLQGTGILEYSPIFYGYYTREPLHQTWGHMEVHYELPLAYLSVMILLMAFCLLVMVKKAAKGLRESLKSTEGEFYQFCNIIFGGWDFCIENTKAAYVKHKAIYNEFYTHLEAERFREETELRTRKQRLVLCLVRLLINLLVLAIIAGAFVLVWYVTTVSFARLGHSRAPPPVTEHLRSYASPLTSENRTFDLVEAASEGAADTNYSFLLNSPNGDDTLLTTRMSTPSASVRTATTSASTSTRTTNSRSHEGNAAFLPEGIGYDELQPSQPNAGISYEASSTSSSSSVRVDGAPFASEGAVYDEPETRTNFESSGAVHEFQSTPVARQITTASVNARTTSLLSVTSEDGGELSESSEEPAATDELHPMLILVYRYLPSATIIALNICVPFLFNQLVVWERYSTSVILRITLMRTVVLRLSALGVLLYALHTYTTKCPTPTVRHCVTPECEGQVLCWETYVGQELYKLTLLDLAVIAFNTFFVNLLRKIVGQHLLQRTSFGRRVGAVEFEIPKHVLDIVYGQTLCWLGMFYAPLLPLITSVKLVLVFYIKYFDCSVNGRQSSQFYRTSRSNALFICILLISFIVTIIPVGYSIVDLTPSVGCGPFRGLDAIWAQMVKLISELPEWVQSVVFFLGTAGFAVPAIVLLSLAGYYYYAVAAANQQLVLMLKGQLVLEGHDKQFLLNRLDLLIKRVNEEERRRSRRDYSDVSAGGSNDLTLQIGASR